MSSSSSGSGDTPTNNHRETIGFWVKVILAVCTVLGTLPGIGVAIYQVHSLRQDVNASRVNVKKAQEETNRGHSSLSIRWISVTSPTALRSKSQLDLLANALGQRRYELRVLAPQSEGASVFDDGHNLSEFIRSAACHCQQVPQYLAKRGAKMGDPDGTWTFLLITNDGGAVARNVGVQGKMLEPSQVKYYNMNDMYSLTAGGKSGLARGAPQQRNLFANAPSASFQIGDIAQRETIAIALFETVESYLKNQPYLNISISQGLIPLKLSYEDPGTEQRVKKNVRKPANDALILASGIETRG